MSPKRSSILPLTASWPGPSTPPPVCLLAVTLLCLWEYCIASAGPADGPNEHGLKIHLGGIAPTEGSVSLV